MEAEKRGLSDYNGEMRRGGRGGGGYRMPSSKDMGSEMGPYGEKVSLFKWEIWRKALHSLHI